MSSAIQHPRRFSGEEVTSCPLCASARQKTVSVYGRTSLRKCLDCDSSFVFPQPSSSTVMAQFEEPAPLSEAEAQDKFENNREPVLRRVAQYIQRRKTPGRILDVGCATGFFLDRFFKNPGWRRQALELSPQAAEVAGRKGIEVCRGDIRQANLPDSCLDVVTVLDTFYYFPHPQSDLAEFHRILNGDGLLVLELPLATSRIFRTSTCVGRLLGRSHRPLLETSDHLFYYTPKSISRLLRGCGYRVEAIIPLSGNRQSGVLRDLAYRAYYFFSLAIYFFSRSSIFLSPRFLVAAKKIHCTD
jgi:SAM-dependent methyltransferase